MAIGTTAALIGSAVVGAGASIYGANKAASASEKAAKGVDKRFQESKAMMAPYTGAGENALKTYGRAIGLEGQDAQREFYDNFQHDPGFETSLNNALSETMKRYSIVGNTGGNLANALLKTGQNAIYGQYQNRLSQLGGLVDTGRAAATAVGSQGQAAAAQSGNLLAQAGQYQGQGIMGAGNALSGGLSNMAGNNQFQEGLAAGKQQPMPAGFGTSWTPWTVNRASI